jgi:hypothetical protein
MGKSATFRVSSIPSPFDLFSVGKSKIVPVPIQYLDETESIA